MGSRGFSRLVSCIPGTIIIISRKRKSFILIGRFKIYLISSILLKQLLLFFQHTYFWHTCTDKSSFFNNIFTLRYISLYKDYRGGSFLSYFGISCLIICFPPFFLFFLSLQAWAFSVKTAPSFIKPLLRGFVLSNEFMDINK